MMMRSPRRAGVARVDEAGVAERRDVLWVALLVVLRVVAFFAVAFVVMLFFAVAFGQRRQELDADVGGDR